eukprot:3789217-Rhodomonas_salina.1
MISVTRSLMTTGAGAASWLSRRVITGCAISKVGSPLTTTVICCVADVSWPPRSVPPSSTRVMLKTALPHARASRPSVRLPSADTFASNDPRVQSEYTRATSKVRAWFSSGPTGAPVVMLVAICSMSPGLYASMKKSVDTRSKSGA